MQDNYLVCSFNLFELHQPIFKYDTTTGKVTKVCISSLDRLSHDLVDVCYKTNTYHIQLQGSSIMMEQIRQEITTYNASTYSAAHMIEIEVL